jgi:type III secretion system low calcium response chaperone LcrH/SycD
MDTTLVQEKIQSALDTMGPEIPQRTKEEVKNIILKQLEQGKNPFDALNFSPELLEDLYAHAYKLFHAGKYQEALGLFSFLCNFDTRSYRYHFAVAASHHYLKHFDEAIVYYMYCSQLEPENPAPHFHMYDCFMQLDNPFGAIRSAYTVVLLTENNPAYEQMHQQAVLECENLKKVIVERFAKKEK